MKKQKAGVGTMCAFGGSLIGLSISQLDNTFGKIMLVLGLILLIIAIIIIVKD